MLTKDTFTMLMQQTMWWKDNRLGLGSGNKTLDAIILGFNETKKTYIYIMFRA